MTPAMCLAIAMFFEARNQGVEGMRVVGEVIQNRVEHKRFPNSVCANIRLGYKTGSKSCAFSFYCDGLSDDMYKFKQPQDVKMRKMAIQMGKEIMQGEMMLPSSVTHYHTVDVKPYWKDHKDFVFEGKVGTHLFYSCKGYC